MGLSILEKLLKATTDMVDYTVYSYLQLTSIFNGMEVFYIYSAGSWFVSLLRWLGMLLTNLLSSLLDGCVKVFNIAWEFLNFGSEEAPEELGFLLNSYLWIPIIICLLILGFKLLFSVSKRGDVKNFMSNLIVLAVVLTILPSVFTSVNSIVFDKSLIDTTNQTVSSIVFRHTTDYYYVYEKYVAPIMEDAKVGDTPAELIDRIKEKKDKKGNTIFDDTFSDKNMYIAGWDKIDKMPTSTNEQRKAKSKAAKEYNELCSLALEEIIDLDEKIDDKNTGIKTVYDFFNFKGVFVTDDIDSIIQAITVEPLSTGIIGEWDDMHFYRYRVDFLPVLIELLAFCIFYLGSAYALLKIAWELVYHRIFLGLLSASDLLGGERIKKALTAVLGLYISIIFICFTITLYNSALDYISGFATGLPYSIITIFLTIIALDAPNIIARYFGVNVATRAGAMTVMGGAALAGRAVSGIGKKVSSGVSKYTSPVRQAVIGDATRKYMAGRNGANGAPPPPVGGTGNSNPDPNTQGLPDPYGHDNSNQAYANCQNLDDYKQVAQQENPDMSKEQQDDLANHKMAEANKDDIYKDAMQKQIADDVSGDKGDLVHTDEQALQEALSDKGYDNDSINGITDKLQDQGAYTQYKDKVYDDIGKQAEALRNGANADHYVARPMDAYEKAAEMSGIATPETKEYMANVAYANANSDYIRQQAKQYQSENGGQHKVNDRQAVSYAISHNLNGCATGINAEYSNSIANHIIDHGSLKYGNASQKRNKGAGAL